MKSVEPLRNALLEWYATYGRKQLPWRVTRDPYYTLVSEFMLQQTQVDRVIPKFEAFVARFPTIVALSQAAIADVLRLWQGLGYNTRGVRLANVAREVVARYGGTLPRDVAELQTLPGVGPYTARAIAAFGFDEPIAPLDTNIRRIVHRLFFGVEFPAKATCTELDERARGLVPAAGHDWNSALMDLGATICTARAPKCSICPLREECAAAPIDARALEALRRAHAKAPAPQNAIPFETTTRYARARIVDRLRALAPGEAISLLDLHRELLPVVRRDSNELAQIVGALERDGLVARSGERLSLRE